MCMCGFMCVNVVCACSMCGKKKSNAAEKTIWCSKVATCVTCAVGERNKQAKHLHLASIRPACLIVIMIHTTQHTHGLKIQTHHMLSDPCVPHDLQTYIWKFTLHGC